MSPPAIDVHDLRKRYGDSEVVRGIDLRVEPGELFGFLGPNGAGKTTAIKMLCTLTAATSGSGTVAGYDITAERTQVRRHIGLVFQEPTVDEYLTAEQNLRFHGQLYGMPRSLIASRIGEVLDVVGLSDRSRTAVRAYSGGMRRRLEIARGLLHTPRVLFLDEPTVGLDPQTRAAVWEYIAKLRTTEDITVFITTHYMDEAEYCDRIAILDDGRVITVDTPEALRGEVGADRLQLTTDDNDAALRQLRDRMGIDATMRDDFVSCAVSDGPRFVPRLFTELSTPVHSVTVNRPSLDDVFMAYTGRSIRDTEKGGAR